MKHIKVDNRYIGQNQPCLIVAEIGINHNGDMYLAKKMIEEAKSCGADAVKFQNYRTEDFICDRSLDYTYVSRGEVITESQYEMFKRYELGKEHLTELKKFSDHINIVFFSTPTDVQGVNDLVDLNVCLLKNGSDYLLHMPLIKEMAKAQIPTILSTGMATFSDIHEAVQAFIKAGGKDLVLLHCTSSYPTPAHEVNLNKIPTLANNFNCPIGFSDHTNGTIAAIGAVALGACVVEKHFTLDKDLSGPDHQFSADPIELREMVQKIRTLEKNLGSSKIEPTASEELGRKKFRLSCVSVKNLSAGHIISHADIMFCRPGTGLPPKKATELLGLKLARPIEKGHVFLREDFS